MKYRILGPALALVGALVYFGAELYLFEHPAFPLDDSWIHLQFARQLAEGEGLTYNTGEPVSGSTAPLWTALLSIGFLLPASLALFWPKLLGLCLLVLNVHAIGRLAKSLDMSFWCRRMAEVMLATSHWWIWSALSGMEILLFSTLTLWGLIVHQQDTPESPPTAIALFAIACLARPEGLLLLVLALGERLMAGGASFRSRGLALSVAVIAVLPTIAFYQWISGSPLPTTFGAKTHGDWNLLPDPGYLWSVLHVFWSSQPILTLLASAGGAQLLATTGTPRPKRLLPFLWLVGQPLAYAVLSSPLAPKPIGNFGRYYFPLLPVLIVLGLLALEPLTRRSVTIVGHRQVGIPLVLAIILLAPQLPTLRHGPSRYLQTVANVEDSDVRMALWLKDRLPDGARLGLQDIGALKFFLRDHYVVDLAGIVTPAVRPILHPTAEQRASTYWEAELVAFLEREQVDYLVLFSSSYPAISNASSGFETVRRLKVKHNVTMAGNELVVLKTPWSKAPDLPQELPD